MARSVTMAWRDVLFCHWPVSRSAVRPTVHDAFDVDLVDGTAWVSLVAFEMVGMRPDGSPIGTSFAQVNARTYVTRGGTQGTYLYSLDAPHPVVVRLGRRWGLPYYDAEVRLRRRGIHFSIGSRRTDPSSSPARFVVTYAPDGDTTPAPPGTLQASLVERTNYVCVRNGRPRTGRLHRDRFSLAPATVIVESIEGLLEPIAGGTVDEPGHCWYGAHGGIQVKAEPPTPIES